MKNNPHFIHLNDRGTIQLSGNDVRSFLQGIISNDINNLTADSAIYALILTPQGKFLYDLFIVEYDNKIWLDVYLPTKDALLKKLKMYTLRADVTLTDVSADYTTVSLLGQQEELQSIATQAGKTHPFCNGIAYCDPRTEKMGARSFCPTSAEFKPYTATGFTASSVDIYHQQRFACNLPEASLDMLYEESYPLQYRMDEFNAISFTKGCYVGQEVTTRTKHRGKVKKLTFAVNNLPKDAEKGMGINANGKTIGKLCSHLDTQGIALLQADQADEQLSYNENIITRL